MLILDLHVGEKLVLDGGRISIVLREKSGRKATLAVDADSSVVVRRHRETEKPGELPNLKGCR